MVTKQRDEIDEELEIWEREIPNLDRTTEGVIERIQILAWNFDRALVETLAESGLDRRGYALLGKLRKYAPDYRAAAGKLAADLRLSSGAMTNRLDRMEAAGLIRRLPDPSDRRGTLVEATELGRRKWDDVVATAAVNEANLTSVLSETEKERLHDLLRELMRAFPDWKQKKHSQPVLDSDD